MVVVVVVSSVVVLGGGSVVSGAGSVVIGSLSAQAELLVFVDDDNFLNPDYLERTLKIARDHPGFGGLGPLTPYRKDLPVLQHPEDLGL